MEGDLEEVPRDGETREAGAEDGVAQGAAAVPSCRRRLGRGGGGRRDGCDSSPGVEGETGEQTGRSRRRRGQHGVRRSGLDEKAAGGGSAVVERRAVQVRIFFLGWAARIWWAWRTLSP